MAELFHLELNVSVQELSRALYSHFIDGSGPPSHNINYTPELSTFLASEAILITQIPCKPLLIVSNCCLASTWPV